MLSDSLKNYLIQTQQLFGDNLILPTIGTDFFVITEGDLNSKILFIKESLDDNPIKEKEKILFYNILRRIALTAYFFQIESFFEVHAQNLFLIHLFFFHLLQLDHLSQKK